MANILVHSWRWEGGSGGQENRQQGHSLGLSQRHYLFLSHKQNHPPCLGALAPSLHSQ